MAPTRSPACSARAGWAQAATEIGHPCIIDVVDYNETEQGYPYFVMEYLEGEDLERRIQRAGPLAPE